jgi:hypothetical protein
MTNENRIQELTGRRDKALDQQKSLLRELSISTALQVEFPDVFEGGTINTKMGCIGDHAVYPDEFWITITKGNGEVFETRFGNTNLSDDILKLMMPKNVTWRKPKKVQDREDYWRGQNV